MGLLDTLFGRTKPVRANLDALFALPSAAVTLQSPQGSCPPARPASAGSRRRASRRPTSEQEIADLLAIPDDAADRHRAAGRSGRPAKPAVTGVGELTQTEDAYGFRWLLLDDPAIETSSPGYTSSTDADRQRLGPPAALLGLRPGARTVTPAPTAAALPRLPVQAGHLLPVRPRRQGTPGQRVRASDPSDRRQRPADRARSAAVVPVVGPPGQIDRLRPAHPP